MDKLKILSRKVGRNSKAIESLFSVSEQIKNDADALFVQAQTELIEAEDAFKEVKVGYVALQARCKKVFLFVEKIFGE